VFISYAHESDEHKQNVLAFAQQLHLRGVGVVLDQAAPNRRIDWHHWATHHILSADFVLVVASSICRGVGDGTVGFDVHRGLQSEMRTLRDLYVADYDYWLHRILPVVLPGMSVEDIPLFLQPYNADHYRVVTLDQAGTADLVRTLTMADPGRHVCHDRALHHMAGAPSNRTHS
jgi:hypothetical protein